MSPNTDELLIIIESLPVDIKTELVEKILESIHPLKKEVDKEWIKIAEGRISEIKSGDIKLIPGDNVFYEIMEKYGI